MKKLILTAAVLLTVGFASAQEKKESTGAGFSNGDAFISGSFGINSTNDKNTNIKTNGFNIVPRVGYFFSENIALGAQIGYASAKKELSGTTTADDDILAVGLFGRYYFTPASQFSVFTELGANYTTAKDKISTVKTNGFNVGLSIGLNYFVSDNFAIEASYAGLNYASEKADVSGAKNVTSFDLGANLNSVSIGLLYKL